LKALILAAGRGSRLGELTIHENKCMLELFGKPILDYNLENAAKTSARELVLVVGHGSRDIMERYGDEFMGKPITYVLQEELLGLVHAMECATDAIDGDDFLLFLGDEVLTHPRHDLMIKQFVSDLPFGLCGVCSEPELAKIERTYSIFEDSDHRIYRMIEKPRKPMRPIKGTGNCVFSNEMLSFVERTPINPTRGQKELPDLVQCAIDENNIVKSFRICDEYTNVNSEDDLVEANRILSHERKLLSVPTQPSR